MKTWTAQMSSNGGPWRLYVVVYGESEWPSLWWEPSAVPTGWQRRDALAFLGYEVVPGASWSWTEDSKEYGDDRTPVVLIAAVQVRELDGGAAPALPAEHVQAPRGERPAAAFTRRCGTFTDIPATNSLGRACSPVPGALGGVA
ncbi:DUF6303 family protein [Streptomyces olivaceus]|uniref:DUF6303 family protein n=1 Tax=Streptomyces olivaceus TaxID=47716 RepID=UPI0007C436BA|nr:DUF6303 family protein [Streptomyces olivaceus]